jgi:hypothetical protein
MCGLVPGGLRVGQEELDVWTMIRPLHERDGHDSA